MRDGSVMKMMKGVADDDGEGDEAVKEMKEERIWAGEMGE